MYVYFLGLQKDTIKSLEPGGFCDGGHWFHKTGVARRGVTYYRCVSHSKSQCPASLKLLESGEVLSNEQQHNHPKPNTSKGIQI